MEPQEICTEHIKKQKLLLKSIEKKLGGKLIFFNCPLDNLQAFYLHKVLRRLSKNKSLYLILESGGGSLNIATKIVNMCRQYFTEFNVIVPSFAKSAATLIALSADRLFLGKAGELGPIDPQVKHPVENVYFPALAIKDAINVIESAKDPYIKMGLTDKIDPYLMGSYKRTLKEAKQHLEKAKLIEGVSNKEEIINIITKTFMSHGYPIDIKECSRIEIPLFEFKDKQVMNLIYDFFEEHVNFEVSFKNIKKTICIMSSTHDEIEFEIKPSKKDIKKSE